MTGAAPPSGARSATLVAVVVGPTAVGKSDLGLALGQILGGELISADSRQVYRFLDIGTAKPTAAERRQVPHHLVDIVTPDEEYTLASFQEDAYRAIRGAGDRGRLPLLVGGTGLYVRAVTEGLIIPRVAPRPALRASLEERVAQAGPEALHAELRVHDPEAARHIHPRNVRRVIRALEVCLTTGKPISALQRSEPPPFRFVFLGLTCRRETLYLRIDERVERQFAAGLVEETRRAFDMGFDYELPSMGGLGHRQAGLYLRGKLSLAEAIQMDKYDSHRFVRQQNTWFRRQDPRIHWLARDEMPWHDLVREAARIVRERLCE